MSDVVRLERQGGRLPGGGGKSASHTEDAASITDNILDHKGLDP